MSILTLVACAVLFLGAADPAPDSRTVRTKDGTVLKVETAVTGLEVPWSIAFTSAALNRLTPSVRPRKSRAAPPPPLRNDPSGSRTAAE